MHRNIWHSLSLIPSIIVHRIIHKARLLFHTLNNDANQDTCIIFISLTIVVLWRSHFNFLPCFSYLFRQEFVECEVMGSNLYIAFCLPSYLLAHLNIVPQIIGSHFSVWIIRSLHQLTIIYRMPKCWLMSITFINPIICSVSYSEWLVNLPIAHMACLPFFLLTSS